MLLEHGAYAPLELVLLMDRLADADHRAWRLAQVSSLDGCLARGSESLRELLDDAADWARRLGLEPAIETYYGWEGAAGKALRCSTDSTLDELLRTVYRRPSDSATQLDLFIDTAKTVARNELCDALLAHDVRRARARLVRVLELEAEHSLTLEAKRLIAALQRPEPADAADARDQLMLIEREWQPAAERVLGVRSRDFLAPLWRRAARKLESAPFDREQPRSHASWAYRQSHDWDAVRRSILASHDYRTHPVLLAGLAEAERHLGERTAAIEHWCELCWRAPEIAETVFQSVDFADMSIADYWTEFQAQDLEPPPAAPWFPAWMLLEERGLARVLPARDGSSQPELAYELLRQLIRSDLGDAAREAVELRQRLKDVHPGLLERYLVQRGW